MPIAAGQGTSEASVPTTFQRGPSAVDKRADAKAAESLPSTMWILSGLTLSVLLVVGILATQIVYNVEEARVEAKIANLASTLLNTIELLHAESMIERTKMEQGDVAVSVFDNFLGNISNIQAGAAAWAFMGPKVLEFQEAQGSLELERPRDTIDEQVAFSRIPYGGFIDSSTFRITRPVVLGKRYAESEKCASCHQSLMGIVPGELIGGLSVSIDASSEQAGLVVLRNKLIVALLIVLAATTTTLIVAIHIVISRPLGQIRKAIKNGLAGNDVEALPRTILAREISELAEATFEVKRTTAAHLSEIELQKMALDEHAIVSIADAEGNITYVNKKFCQVSGYTEAELLGRNHRIVRSNEHSPEFYRDLWMTISVGDVWSGIIKNRKKGGGDYWVESTIVPQLNDEGLPVKYVSIRTEISATKMSEHAMRQLLVDATETRERLEAQAAELVLMSEIQAEDKSKLDVAVRQYAKQAEEEQALSQLLKVAIHAEDEFKDVTAFLEKSLEVLLSETPWLDVTSTGMIFFPKTGGSESSLVERASINFTSELSTMFDNIKPGRFPWEQVALTRNSRYSRCVDEWPDMQAASMRHHGLYNIPLLNDSNLVGVLTLYLGREHESTESDIDFLHRVASCLVLGTLLRRHMSELEISSRLAQQATVAKSQFLASMSHEIRTPLNGVMGMLRLMANTRLDGAQSDYVATALKSADQLLTLLNDILDLSKAESGKMEYQLQPVNVEQVASETVQLFSPSASEKSLTLGSLIDDQLPKYVLSDPLRLKQVLNNLVGNAIKFTSFGNVTLSVRYEGNATEGRIILDVQDSGIGLSAVAQRKIFAPFQQADGSTTREYGGTGLGLSICKKLAEGLNGSICVSSIEGQGSTFSVTLPVQVTSNIADDFLAVAAPASQSGLGTTADSDLRILVADDNAMNRQVVSLMLNSHWQAIELVENGEEALHALEREEFDLILMDIQMPIMDGISATKHIRECGKPYGDIPIIALTANAMSGDRAMYLAAGMNAYVSKPIDPEVLFSAIDSVITKIDATHVADVSQFKINRTKDIEVDMDANSDDLLEILESIDT
jgi:PAS domain S-box-containing protein